MEWESREGLQFRTHKISPSLWNEFDRGYLITHLLVKVEVVSPKLWVLPLTSSQIEKYNYIKKKRDEGYYYYQISDMMNESNFKPKRTDKFTPQQVWGLEFKMEKRLKRLDKIENPKVISIRLIKTKKKI